MGTLHPTLQANAALKPKKNAQGRSLRTLKYKWWQVDWESPEFEVPRNHHWLLYPGPPPFSPWCFLVRTQSSPRIGSKNQIWIERIPGEALNFWIYKQKGDSGCLGRGEKNGPLFFLFFFVLLCPSPSQTWGAGGAHEYLKHSSLWVPLPFLSFPPLSPLPRSLLYPIQQDKKPVINQKFYTSNGSGLCLEPQFRKLCVNRKDKEYI